MQISVKNQNGELLDSIELSDAVFNVPMNPSLVHQAMVIYQGNKRQGTHDTKTRAEVSGGGRKPWIQKHTGRARQGSIRSPQWRHGGVVFGPHPRSYRAALPKRMKRLALRCVLSDKARKDRLFCLDSTDTIDGKTKSMTQLLENLAIAGSALVVTMGSDRDVVLAAHNIKKIWTIPVHQLNAQELLARDMVIMTVEAARWAEETFAVEPHGRRGTKWATIGEDTNGPAVAEPEEAATEIVAEDAAPEAPVEEEAPVPRTRRRTTARSTDAAPEAASEAATEAPAEEETPAPRTRRRRTTASAADAATPEIETEAAAEASAEEETPAPRTRRRRTTARASEEPTDDTPAPETESPAEPSDSTESPEEES